MSFFIGPNLPANVIEIGQEISQTKLDEINAGTIATQAWVIANAGGGVTIPYLEANYQTLSGMSSYLTTASATSTYAPKASPTFTGTVTIPAGASISGYLTSATATSTYQTIAGMSSYLTTANAATTYQTQSGMSSYLTTSSASSTYATKSSPTFTGTVVIPAGASISGYLTTASASSTYAPIASPTFTGTVTIPAGASISGYLTSGTAATTYQTISGMSSYLTTANAASTYLTIANAGATYLTQSSASSTYAPKANPTFTGTVTIPAGANISGYLTNSSAAANYQTISGMSSYLTTANAQNAYASKFDPATGSYGAVYDVPMDGVEYVRKNQSWVTATGGGGGLTISTLSNAATSTLNATAPTTGQALTFDGTQLIWATVGGGGGGISDAPSDGVTYGRLDGAWTSLSSYATQTWVSNQNYLTAKTIQAVSGTYTVQAGDQNKIILFTTTMGGDTIYLPADSTYAFPNGTEITVCQYSGVSGNGIAGQYYGQPTINGSASVSVTQTVSKLVKVGTDVWLYT